MSRNCSTPPVARTFVSLILAAPVLATAWSSVARAAIDFEPSWRTPDYDSVRADVDAWVDDVQPESAAVEAIDALWPDEPADGETSLLDRVAETFAAADPRAANLVRACGAAYAGPTPPAADWLATDWLATDEAPPLVRNNLRLFYARWLTQYGLYDEALAAVDGLQPADVVDPAALLFYRMAAHHQLVQPDEARVALAALMERKDELPQRFLQVAQLVERDLAGLDDESLDHIARRMNDIRRRLAYGRAGSHVQQLEREVLESLDDKIKRLEQQQRQQNQQGQSGGAMRPSQPMQDSRLPQMRAAMQVEQRDIGHESGWGDLPPREREQALQQIGRDFPAHYRDLIEQYFRELASETAPPAN